MVDRDIVTDDHGLPRTPMTTTWVSMVWAWVTMGNHVIAMVDRGIAANDHG